MILISLHQIFKNIKKNYVIIRKPNVQFTAQHENVLNKSKQEAETPTKDQSWKFTLY